MNTNINEPMEQKAEDRHLDCTTLMCPMPLVRISQAVKEMAPGQTLLIEACDPAFKPDIEAWIRTTGHELLEFTDGPIQRALVRKSSSTGKAQ
jgi:tRNA 2-thiouridine synthesizing protein A